MANLSKEIKTILLLLVMLLSTSMVWAAKENKSVNITVGGETRSYWLYVPTNVKENAPLVFSLHGTSGHSTDKAPFRTDVADAEGCIVVYPQGKSLYFPVFGGNATGWHSTGEYSEDIDFFKAIIEEIDEKYGIDRNRIYCCGFSNGGMMTYTVANLCSDIFAAFASISGYPINEFHLHHTSARPVPFLHIHGKADDFVKYSLMPAIVDNMVARNGALPTPTKRTSSGKFVKSTYPATDGGFPYVYYEIDGMGHNDFTTNTEEKSSAKTMWKFMSQYTLDSECDKTLKWRPNIDATNYSPKDHGWMMNSSTTLLLFGREQKTDANQNVYRSLQFENGKYKLCFRAEGEEGKKVSVKLQQLTGKKTVVLQQDANVNEDVAILFEVTNGWGEYRLTMSRESATDEIAVKNLAIYSATDDDPTAVSSIKRDKNAVAAIYTVSGTKISEPKKGINIVRKSDGSLSKVIYK